MAHFQALTLSEGVSKMREDVVFEVDGERQISVDLRVRFFVEEEEAWGCDLNVTFSCGRESLQRFEDRSFIVLSSYKYQLHYSSE